MSQFRGAVLVIFGMVAFYRAWQLHSGRMALLAVLLGVVSLAVGVWRIASPTEIRPRQ